MFFQITAIIILLIFYGCYFGKLFSQKKKGIQTDQLGKGKTGFVKFIEVTLKIVTIIVPVAEVASILSDTSAFPPVLRYIGVAIALIGDAVFICSVLTMRDNWRAGVAENDKTELVTNGIYQISRNPAFLGFNLVYLGILLMFFNLVLFYISLLASLLIHLQIVNVEEDFLVSEFGEDYKNYKKKVCRYFGRKFRK